MATAIIILFSLAIFHFVYEGILLPSMRMSFRNRLFQLRDELRMLKLQDPERISGDAFDIVHDGLNNFLNRIPHLTVRFRYEFHRRVSSDPRLKDQLERRRAVVDNGPAEVVQIAKRADEVIHEALAANGSAWIVYLVPVLIFAFMVRTTARQIRDLMSLPNAKLVELFRVRPA